MALKNPRHEKFAREYVKTGIGKDASEQNIKIRLVTAGVEKMGCLRL